MNNDVSGSSFLFCKDVDVLVAKQIFKAGKMWRAEIIKNIFISFGRSCYDGFIKICQKEFFCQAGLESDGKLDVLLQKVIGKGNLQFFPCYKTFSKLSEHPKMPRSLQFSSCNAKHRVLIFHLSIYHGYIPVSTVVDIAEKYGGSNYEKFWSGRESATYLELKKARVHNLKYYNRIKKGRDFWQDEYELKSDAWIYKRGPTIEEKDIYCIKL